VFIFCLISSHYGVQTIHVAVKYTFIWPVYCYEIW